MNCKQVARIVSKGGCFESNSRIYDASYLCPTITTCQGGGRVTKILNDHGVRQITPGESWKLMGFTESDFMKVRPHFSDTQLYKMAGNSIAVPVLEHLFTALIEAAIL